MLIPKTYRVPSRKLARSCYIRCGGDVKKAHAMAKLRKKEVGNPFVMLTIGVLVIQGIYYALKIWNEMNLSRPPVEPLPGEGFELASGEKYALTHNELRALMEADDED